MKNFTIFILCVLAMDVLGYSMWQATGQIPQDRGHLGIITETIVHHLPWNLKQYSLCEYYNAPDYVAIEECYSND